MITRVAKWKYGKSLSTFLAAHTPAYTFNTTALNNGGCNDGDGEGATSDVLKTVGEYFMMQGSSYFLNKTNTFTITKTVLAKQATYSTSAT